MQKGLPNRLNAKILDVLGGPIRSSRDKTAASLFRTGSLGIAYDFSITPNFGNPLYQDNTGSALITLPDQTMGMALDTSRGLVLGSELITNGDFLTGITGWNSAGATISDGAGTLRAVGTGTGTGFYGAGFSVTSGFTYRFIFTIKGDAAYSTLQFGLRRTSSLTAFISSTYTPSVTTGYTQVSAYITASATVSDAVFFCRFAGSEAINIDDISVKQISSVPLTQANAGLRPKWGRAPTSRRNLLTYTQQLDIAPWVTAVSGVVAPVRTANSAIAPDGTNTASKLDFPAVTGTQYSVVQQTIGSGQPVVSRVASVWLKAATVGDIGRTVFVYGPSQDGQVAAILTGDWQRVSTGAHSNSVVNFNISTIGSSLSGGLNQPAFSALVWGAQLEIGSSATTYQKVTNQFDMTEAGVPAYGFARFDRSDDIMSATIPVAQTGDVLVFGRSGSWIETNVTYDAGSTWSIGVNTVTGLPTGLLAAIGDIVGVVAIGRTLTATERTMALNYHKARGAAGWLVAGAEVVVNGGFATDTVWIKGAGWTIGSGAANCDGSQGATSYLYQSCLTVGVTYETNLTVTGITGAPRISLGNTAPTISLTAGANRFIQTCSGNSNVLLVALVGSAFSVDDISVKPLTVAP